MGPMDSHPPLRLLINEHKLSGLGVRSGWQLLSHRNASGQQLKQTCGGEVDER